jgi:SAM-dependent methyltransferase
MLPRKLSIRPGDRVLEIGSGARPHSRSNILVDRFPGTTPQREDQPLRRDARPLVLADGCQLPFRDKSFDYVICVHVLEHVQQPELLLREMQRVARAGYIETPTELFDFLFNVPPYPDVHLWYVNVVEGELVITRKHPGNSANRFAYLLDNARREDPYFERWLEKSPHLFTVQFEWQDHIPFRIAENSTYADTTDPQSLAAKVLREADTAPPFFWGSGLWGFKRWVYSRLVHPAWRKRAKRLVKRR